MKTMIGLVLALLGLGTVAAASDNCSQSTGCVPLTVTVSSGAGASAIAIPGATVTIYQTKPGSPRVLAEGTSDDEGQFSLKLPPDGNDDIRYAVARKGQAIELAAVIGTTTPSAITINEMTTVAAAYAMAQFFRDGQIVGKSLPLQVAAGMAANLASVTTGTVSPVIQAPPNANETNALRSLGTLSNILAACAQDTSAACAPLFALAGEPQAPIATTTLQAALNIARNPTTNLKQLFALGEVVRAYEPYLSAEHGPDSSNELLRLDGFRPRGADPDQVPRFQAVRCQRRKLPSGLQARRSNFPGHGLYLAVGRRPGPSPQRRSALCPLVAALLQAADAGDRGTHRHGGQCLDHQQLEAEWAERRGLEPRWRRDRHLRGTGGASEAHLHRATKGAMTNGCRPYPATPAASGQFPMI
jgi:hypothetical protein